jgi:hypothetical protein
MTDIVRVTVLAVELCILPRTIFVQAALFAHAIVSERVLNGIRPSVGQHSGAGLLDDD